MSVRELRWKAGLQEPYFRRSVVLRALRPDRSGKVLAIRRVSFGSLVTPPCGGPGSVAWGDRQEQRRGSANRRLSDSRV